jgi:hypothetical protein
MKNLISSIKYGKYLDSAEISNGSYRQQRQKYDAFLERPIQKKDFISVDRDLPTFQDFNIEHGIIWYGDNVINDECFGITKIKDLIDWNLTLTKEF